VVVKAAGVSRTTVFAGFAELDRGAERRFLPPPDKARVRAQGGGRKTLVNTDSTLLRDLDALVEPTTRGDPMLALRWTCKSATRLAQELNLQGHQVSQRTVCDLLAQMHCGLQSVRKTREGAQHPDRDAQFHHIAKTVAQYQRKRQPVISVDTKKKELIEAFKNAGREWQPAGQPEQARTPDFIDQELGKVAACGVCDVKANEGWVSVGIDHDRAEFAVQSIRRWWLEMGRPLYTRARCLLITADCGGRNGYRVRLWRLQLQRLADELGLTVQVCHPAGHQQVEQDRAPRVLPNHPQLAGPTAADTSDRRELDRRRDHRGRVAHSGRTRREGLRRRRQGHGRGTGRRVHRAR